MTFLSVSTFQSIHLYYCKKNDVEYIDNTLHTPPILAPDSPTSSTPHDIPTAQPSTDPNPAATLDPVILRQKVNQIALAIDELLPGRGEAMGEIILFQILIQKYPIMDVRFHVPNTDNH